jgi:GxxExxY protein
MEKDLLTEKIIGCCFEVHNDLGPGFNEKAYQKALALLFEKNGLTFETEKSFIINYLGRIVGEFRVDFLVEAKVVLEIKAVSGDLQAVFGYQVLSYLKASGLHIGLLVNFGEKSCEVKRFIY